MAKVTISELVHKLTLDGKDFDKNAIASRKEISHAKRALRELRDPMEQYEHDLDKAAGLLKFGADGQELYNRAVAKAKKRLQDLNGETQRAAELEERLNDDRKLANRIIDTQVTRLQRLEREQRDVNRLHDQGMIDARQYRREMDRLNDEMREARREASLFSQVGQRIGDSFGLGGIFGADGSRAIGQVALIGAGVQLAERYFQLMQRGAEFAVRRLNEDREAIDNLAKSSAAIGVEIDRLTGLQFAAGQTSGLGDDQTLKALQEITKRSSEAAQGLGESRLAFAELGIEAAVLNDLAPDQKLLKIADAIKNVESRSDRFRIAGKLFGEENAKIVTTLEKGSDAIEAMIDRADNLGLSISAVDASKVEAMNDSIDSFQRSLIGLSRTLTIEAAADIEELFDVSTDLIQLLLENKDVFLGFFDVAVLDNIRTFTELLKVAESSISSMERAIDKLDETLRLSGLTSVIDNITGGNLEAGEFIRGAIGLGSSVDPSQSIQGAQVASIIDPADSIAAGSREAFNIEYRTEVSGQMEIAREQLEVAKTNADANAEAAQNLRALTANLQQESSL